MGPTTTDDNSIPLPQLSRGKRVFAGIGHYSGASGMMRAATGWLRGWPRIRAINYHQTAAVNAANFESHLRFYRQRFSPVTHAELIGLLEHNKWNRDKPGLLISFDDGARNNYDVAAPLLDRYGFVGWFFAPAGFVNCPVRQQRDFARSHDLLAALVGAPATEPRVAMSWDELRDLRRRGHVVGCHTMNHRRMSASLSPAELLTEVVESRSLLNEHLAGGVDSFCWVGGEEGSYSASAARMIAESGYRLGFMTNSEMITSQTHPLQLNRTNVEDRYPIHVVTLLLSGLMDLRFAEYRKRINSLTSISDVSRTQPA